MPPFVLLLAVRLDRLSTGRLHRNFGVAALPPPGISQPRYQDGIQEPRLVERVRGRAQRVLS